MDISMLHKSKDCLLHVNKVTSQVVLFEKYLRHIPDQVEGDFIVHFNEAGFSVSHFAFFPLKKDTVFYKAASCQVRIACTFLIHHRAKPRSLNAYHFHKYSLLYTHTKAWREDLQVSPRLLCAMLFHSVYIYSDSVSFSVLHRQTCTIKVLQELRRRRISWSSVHT